MTNKLVLRNGRKSLLSSWKYIDCKLLLVYIGMTIFGGIIIQSVEKNQGLTDWWQHWLTGGVGLILALIIARCRYEVLVRWKWAIYILTNISLVAVQALGTSALGAQRWINVAGFHVQPSEFAKVGIIITLAAILSSKPKVKLFDLFQVLIVTAIPWLLVFLEPNLGTSLIFGVITIGMLYWGNINPGWLILLVSPIFSIILHNLYTPAWFAWITLMALIAWRSLPWGWLWTPIVAGINICSSNVAQTLWHLLKDYQKDRLTGFLNPEQDPLGTGYHLIQSRIAIGSGQLFGRGLYQGTQTQLNFIPEQHTDFIFSAIGEEFGFIGCIFVLFAFWFICLRLVIIAYTAKDNFGSLIAIGVLSMLIFQVFVNIGMNIGLAPVTGIPLPLLSYGRSALLSNFIALGLVESVANNKPKQNF
ncbi:cell cycle protein [Trichodesmium erythraeum IMS101]|uniref:Peptidoglycan glycosyltransferase RodA n=1 Tax=Trichodesmium erythraeum (strain IMS101) TaxID=203124 RepID=Q10ZB6_TRIEI|nr:rod shape-determining protein RodA [Trichodesmium erythraeum GBRTRLIN201]MCH2047226.1 rod shape-determining protein RodA [Trichodesmium sp. ALOHA_ZT_67]MDE5093136.1 rod shape-determining protein RodA [Trichodesmium sp. St11_bin5]